MGEQQPTVLDDPKRTLTIHFTDLKIGLKQTGQLTISRPPGGRMPTPHEVAEELARLNEDLPPDWAQVCAWCKTFITGNKNAIQISHGMCSKCAKDWSDRAAVA